MTDREYFPVKDVKKPIFEDIRTSISNAINLSNDTGDRVVFQFNGVAMTVDERSEIDERYTYYRNELDRIGKEAPGYKEGVSRERELKIRAQENNDLVDQKIDGVKLDVVDEAQWQTIIAENTNNYGAFSLDYAERWGKYMQVVMLETDQEIREIADQTSFQANSLDVSGAAYMGAVNILTTVWKHKDQLNEWYYENSKPSPESGITDNFIID